MVTNQDLKEIYNSKKLSFHPGFDESMMLVHMMKSWQDLNVLEIGCGEGHLASILAYAGAFVVGIDFAEKQIETALHYYGNVPNLGFSCRHYRNGHAYDKYDVVVMQGVLEHFDEPWTELKWILEHLAPIVCLSFPYWANPRGYVYHTLRLLFNAKMTLTDLHFFHIWQFEDFCKENGYIIEDQWGCDENWARGKEMIEDLSTRIPKAMPTIEMPENNNLMQWLEDSVKDCPFGQATMGLKIINPRLTELE